ncbi:2-(R)-hydroxypropyl-CoM dehydrogenase [bacterium HR30]|nr:2-(R)-hydroxypropyl-CoM dehydrogenase [bacterium HR30]
MAGKLVGKVALITGAAGGIGAATVRRFVAEGARVLMVDRDGAVLSKLAAEVRSSGAEVEWFEADVSREEQCRAMVRHAEDRFGALHILFNNAGIFPDEDGSVTETSEEVLDRVLAVNVKGVFFGCKHGIPALLRAGGGSIINTASFVALMGAATSQSAYTASKGAVLALTREIAVEYARKGIRANALCPGPVNTPLLESLLADPVRRARRLVHIPMGRLAEADEIARAVLFLASDDSSYVTGTAFLVDGGITAAYVTPE